MTLLTIAILSLPERLPALYDLLKELNYQKQGKPVQFIYVGDDERLTVGEKRNKAVAIADGNYLAFVDDDDMIRPGYIEKLLEGIKTGADVVTFFVKWFKDEQPDRVVAYENCGQRTLDPTRKIDGLKVLAMPPNHLCAWKRELIKPYPHKTKGEDHDWAENMQAVKPRIHEIPEILYDYKFDKTKSRARGRTS